MKKSTKNAILSLAIASFFTVSNVNADDKNKDKDDFGPAVYNKKECPVNPAYPNNTGYDGASLVGVPADRVIDAEFGPGAQDITQCMNNREDAKIVVRVDHTFMQDAFGAPRLNKPLFLANIDKMINQYENTHGMEIGKDVDIKVVFSGSGAILATTGHRVFVGAAMKWNAANPDTPMTVSPANPYIEAMQRGMDAGIKFYLCQEASRTLGITMANKIPGINFVPAAHAATADFQMDGYAIVIP